MTGADSSEHELIRRARAGDQDAFAELVVAHADRVYGALRRFGLDADEADEVAQEVFVRAWRGLARFEERSQFSTWLYRIAFNEAQRRLSRRAPRVPSPSPIATTRSSLAAGVRRAGSRGSDAGPRVRADAGAGARRAAGRVASRRRAARHRGPLDP